MFKGLQFALSWALLLSVPGLSFSRSHRSSRRPANQALPTIVVRVSDYAAVPGRTLSASEREAELILGRAGIGIVWVECRPGSPAGQSAPACSMPLGGSQLVLRILPTLAAFPRGADAASLGYAVGDLATVSYHHAERLAAAGGTPTGWVLGAAIAHEIGHILLPGRAHNLQGIMSTWWGREATRLMAQNSLIFAPEESKLLRAEVLARASGNSEIPLRSSGSRPVK